MTIYEHVSLANSIFIYYLSINITSFLLAVPIVQMDKDDFICKRKNAYEAIAALIALMIFVAITSISCYVYRFEIKVHLFEKLDWHPFDKQEEDDGKKHDVYLMYCQADESWVINTLLVGLNKFGYKTCVPDRDFAVGASTAAEMAEAFSKTRRVLVVLSQSFVNNKYAMSDFYHAYEHDRSATRRRFLVLVKLREKINFGRHDIFKKYLSTNYFLSITISSFWSRLRYWLPPIDEQRLPTITDNMATEDIASDEELEEILQPLI